ncbi:MAG: DUF5615 family PIN-like protein [bacterium]|jgi:predicted nuclease of predicted toxin-antitoxin system|nr:DUF5615 family PIN-like protein [bacterium]
MELKFIVDAQLPRSLARLLNNHGYDTLHTLDLPNQNATQDLDIVKRSMAEKRVVISKDFDFYDRFFRKLEPYKLLYISTGNIPNQQLLNIFQSNLPKISEALDTGFVIEITRSSIIVID